MAALKHLKLAGFTLGSALLAPALIAACSSSNSNQTPPVYGGTDAGDATVANGEGGAPVDDGSTEAAPDTSTTSDDASDGATSNVSQDGSVDAQDAQGTLDALGDVGTEAGPVACSSALNDAGCWVCPSPSNGSLEFLNQCAGTGVKCVPFDNLSRLPGFDAGFPPH